MIETRNGPAFPTKSPITTYRQLTNQIHNMNPQASKSVTLKLNRILIHLQPPALAKQENQKYIKSANSSLSNSIIVNKPEKGSPLKKTLFEFPKQGLNKSKESVKLADVSQKKDVYLKNPHQRSLSHGHLRPMEKSETKDSTTFIKNIGTPQAFRIEKAPTVARAKISRVGEHYYKLSAVDISGINKSKLPSDSVSKFSKLHSRQGSVVDLKPDLSKLEDELPNMTINSNPKRATSRRVKIKSVDLGIRKVQVQPVPQGDMTSKLRNLIFNPNPSAEVLKGHVKMIKEGLNYAINNLKPPSISYVESRQVLMEKRDKKFSKTLILDLDETLISSCKAEDGPDLILTPREGVDMKVMIKVRPYAQQFLNIMKEHFEIFVFTASSELYAKTVVKALDPEQECISYVFHRSFCFETNKGLRIKDLRIFKNRELRDLIIVDNFVPAFSFQIENGVPILEWKSDKEDKELLYLVDYLVKAKEYKDIRDYNREKLGLLDLAKENVEDEIIL